MSDPTLLQIETFLNKLKVLQNEKLAMEAQIAIIPELKGEIQRLSEALEHGRKTNKTLKLIRDLEDAANDNKLTIADKAATEETLRADNVRLQEELVDRTQALHELSMSCRNLSERLRLEEIHNERARSLSERLARIAERLGIKSGDRDAASLLQAIDDAIRRLV